MKKTSIALAFSTIAGLSLVSPVYAESPLLNRFENKVENRIENKMEKREDLREKNSTKPGLFRGIFKNTRAIISNAKLVAKTDTVLTIEKDGKSYTVNIDGNTKLERRFWGKATILEMSVGDTVNVAGLWSDDAHTIITAKLVRDLSIQKRFGIFFGEVKSLLSSGWVMTTISDKRTDQTVTVDSNTKFTNRKGETITKADVVVGQKVRVRGLWNRNDNTVTEVTEVKDFSLPVQVKTTPTVTLTPTVSVTATVAPTATP